MLSSMPTFYWVFPRVRSQNLRPALSCDPLPLHRRHFRHALPVGLLCLPVPLQQPHAMNGHRLEAIRYKTISRLTTIQKLTRYLLSRVFGQTHCSALKPAACNR